METCATCAQLYKLLHGLEKKRDRERHRPGHVIQFAYRVPADKEGRRRPPRARRVDAAAGSASGSAGKGLSSWLELSDSGFATLDGVAVGERGDLAAELRAEVAAR